MCRNQLLIGGAYTDASLKGLFGESESRLPASHGLTDHADLGILEDSIKIMYHPVRIGAVGEFAKIKDVFDLYAFGNSSLHRVTVNVKELDHSAANCSESQYCNFYHLVVPFLSIYCNKIIFRSRGPGGFPLFRQSSL